jgi:hypothetical protein
MHVALTSLIFSGMTSREPEKWTSPQILIGTIFGVLHTAPVLFTDVVMIGMRWIHATWSLDFFIFIGPLIFLILVPNLVLTSASVLIASKLFKTVYLPKWYHCFLVAGVIFLVDIVIGLGVMVFLTVAP